MSSTLITTVILAIAITVLAAAGIGIRAILIKGGEVRKSCSSSNPLLNDSNGTCGLCGSAPGESCGKDNASNP
ncbi:MAG: membrane or secreted protein [Bacteroidia bacterium]|nr:membrane or secreted protein [Bacteroidia bacterium]MCO5253009.1 membrane or secreted protein [Bacteroidota bacterium]